MEWKNKVEWTNPNTDEKFIHKERIDGSSQCFYGPKDTSDDKRHGHVEFGPNRSVDFNRDPKLPVR